jgi:hypothetical protein
VFVVDFVRAAYAPGIPVIRIPEELKPLVDEDIVNHKVRNSIGQDTETNRVSLPKGCICRGHQQRHADHRIKNKKGVISFKPGVVVFVVVILVKGPQEAMHNVFMGEPRHKLHKAKGSYKQCDPVQYLHKLYQI